MEIQIENCNSIDLAKITLEKNKLNIKFAPNGTGKSTIANALFLNAQEDLELLNQLIPFKLRKDNPQDLKPKVTIQEQFRSVMRFNEEYISKFVFKEDELLSNSFEVLIKNDEYLQIESEIEELIKEIKTLFSGNQELDSLSEALNRMSSLFTLTKTGLAKSSAGAKGLSTGNKIQHIPKGLEPYTPFIQSVESLSWIDWQTKGQNFVNLSDSCPFCTSNTVEKKEQISRVTQEYDSKIIKHLVSIVSVINELGDYFSEECKSSLLGITLLKDGIEPEHESYLIRVKGQIDDFIKKLLKLKMLSAFQFSDTEKLSETLESYKLDLTYFTDLRSEKMESLVTPINASIQVLIGQAGHLKGKINRQKIKIRQKVEQHQEDINNFLASAGYKYNVQIIGEGEQAQLRLHHLDHIEEYLKGGSQYLSFGERNAFAIVLFMYECLAKNPDLIILDDPISSFDKNKKYAILEMLFRRDARVCLKGSTVLMLTHDVEPIIDTIKSLSAHFGNQTTASFLEYRNGEINDISIDKEDIKTFSQICKTVLESEKDQIIKLIFLRRLFEVTDNKGDAYQIISNVLHGRDIPIDTREAQHPVMEESKISNGYTEIEKHLVDFSYSENCYKLKDQTFLKELYRNTVSGYEKLQVFRLFNFSVSNSVVQKFINETYHVENEYICQLDPVKFDTIPQYVVLECDQIISSILENELSVSA